MRLPKRGEKGFTLIELLIVVAILGVLAAVVIPNVGRFIGAGEEEAGKTELADVQSAVHSMMVDNEIDTLPVPVDGTVGQEATNDMSAFPDKTTLAADRTVYGTEVYTQNGYLLYGHQVGYDSDDDGTIDDVKLVNYLATDTAKGTYTVDASGTVEQVSTGY